LGLTEFVEPDDARPVFHGAAMNSDKLIVSLLAACIGLAFLAVFAASVCGAWLVLAEVYGQFVELWRRFRRRPQFGMRNLLSMMVMISLACAMLRWFGIANVYGAVTFGVVLLVWAAGIVCGVEFAVVDFTSQYRPRRKHCDDRPLELWEESPEPKGPSSDAAR
jgi:EamA domain-containing membrane protein RarD